MYPIINRGTWARVEIYREQLVKFLTAWQQTPKTILNLGAGYDSNFFWLHDHHPNLVSQLTWIEVDFDSVVERKIEIIKKTASMSQKI